MSEIVWKRRTVTEQDIVGSASKRDEWTLWRWAVVALAVTIPGGLVAIFLWALVKALIARLGI